MSFMEITPAAMENSTMGTTTNFSRFRKMSPQGLMYALAKSFPSMPPTLIFISAIPAAMPTSRPTKIQNASGSFLLLSISHTPSRSGNARFFFYTCKQRHFCSCYQYTHLPGFSQLIFYYFLFFLLFHNFSPVFSTPHAASFPFPPKIQRIFRLYFLQYQFFSPSDFPGNFLWASTLFGFLYSKIW